MQKTILFILALTAFRSIALADSPITSTPIHEAYQDIGLVAKASAEKAVFDADMLAFLADADKPIDQKVALCSALGWQMKGKAKRFSDHLSKRPNWNPKQMSGDEMLVLSYLMALDDYNNMDLPLALASKALARNKQSYTYRMIHALILAQKQFDSSWCKLFTTVAAVERNKSLRQDLRNQAVNIIFDYINLYQENCKGSKGVKNPPVPMRG
jgi:hypothetical protein